MVVVVVQFKGHTMSKPFKYFNIGLASLMAITAIASSIAAVRYIVVSDHTAMSYNANPLLTLC